MTLALAVIGTLLSLLSLSWQAFTWSRSGAVIRVTASNSFPVFGEELGNHHVTVTAVNKGRAATTLTHWGIDMGNGSNAVVLEPLPWSTQLPHRLEPGAEAAFHIPAAELRNYHQQTKRPFSLMRPWVSRAGSQKTFGKSGLPLA